jgi:hypothetical protein
MTVWYEQGRRQRGREGAVAESKVGRKVGGEVEEGGGEKGRAWRYHEQLLDALHDALDGAERLSPLNDGCSLAALDALLVEAGQAIRGLRGQGSSAPTSL